MAADPRGGQRGARGPGRAVLSSSPTVFTVGHSTRPIEEFTGLLTAHGVTLLMDVRTVPGSRHNPQYNREVLPGALAIHGIGYEHMPGLGGFRKTHPDSPNAGWRNRSFRGYADYMLTPEFVGHLEDLIERARSERVAVMCSEAVPWRCHRSLIADALLVRGIQVEELVSPTRTQTHRLTPFARVEGTVITYPEG